MEVVALPPRGVGGEMDSDTQLDLGELDVTTGRLSLAGLDQEIAALEGSEVLRAVCEQGLDPRDCGREYEGALREAELASIEDYVSESGNLGLLHAKIQECDSVLAGMEEVLGRFQNDLGSLSSEIRSLQEQSASLHASLKSSRACKERVEGFLDRVALPPAVAVGVLRTPPGEPRFAAALQSLARLRAEAAAHEGALGRSAAAAEVAPELERLTAAASASCRAFLLERVLDLRRPKTNIQIKQSALGRHAVQARFLQLHAPRLFEEVRAAYAEHAGAKLLDLFRAYWAAAERLQVLVFREADLLGGPDEARAGEAGSGNPRTPASAGFFGGLLWSAGRVASSAPSSAPPSVRGGQRQAPAEASVLNGGPGGVPDEAGPRRASAAAWAAAAAVSELPWNAPGRYALGERQAGVCEADAPPLVLATAEAEGRRFFFEALFRSLCKLLQDAAAHEYLFCARFWRDAHLASAVLEPALTHLEKALHAAFAAQHDALALALCAASARRAALAMSLRAVPALDAHHDRLLLLLWPRLKQVLDAHAASVQAAVSPHGWLGQLSPRAAPAPAALAARHGAMAAALRAVGEAVPEADLEATLARLQYGLLSALLAASRRLQPAQRGAAFLVLNLSCVALPLREEGGGTQALPAGRPADGAGGGGGTGQQQAPNPLLQEVERSLARATGVYVDALLKRAAPALETFVHRGEVALARGRRRGEAEGEQEAGGAASSPLATSPSATSPSAPASSAPAPSAPAPSAPAPSAPAPSAPAPSASSPSSAAPSTSSPSAPPLPPLQEAEAIVRAISGAWQELAQQLVASVAADLAPLPLAARAVTQAVTSKLLLRYSRFLDLLKRHGPPGRELAARALPLAQLMQGLNAAARC